MNLLLLIFAIVGIANIITGYRKGIVRSVISLISLVVLSVVIILIGNGLDSYFEGEFINVAVMVLFLCLVGILQHLLNVVFFSAKMISKLPIVHTADKLLGAVFGIVETVLILWTIYTFIMLIGIGMIGEQIKVYTQESPILTWLYENNYLAVWVERLMEQIPAL